MSNSSLDFLNMIKNQSLSNKMASMTKMREDEISNNEEKAMVSDDTPKFAVIDTETNWRDEVMSIGVAIARVSDFKCVDRIYYIFDPECVVGGIYSNVLHMRNIKENTCSRNRGMAEIKEFLDSYGVTKILAYNAKFDYSHLDELSGYEWFDIMRLAAYKQYNAAIPDSLPCCKTGRLKTNYGVEPIMCLLTGDSNYTETHNALLDSLDELKIVELLNKPLQEYECGKVNK